MGQMLDGLEKGDQTLTGNLDEFLQQKGFAYHQADQGLAEGAQRAELTGKAVELDPKVKLDSFISQNQIDLSTAPKGRMMTIQGMQDVPMYPGTKEELYQKYSNISIYKKRQVLNNLKVVGRKYLVM